MQAICAHKSFGSFFFFLLLPRVRQRWGAASSSFFSLFAVHPAGLRNWERGGVQDAETDLQKHPGRWISQHTSQTGCECLLLYWSPLINAPPLIKKITTFLDFSMKYQLIWFCFLIGSNKSGPLHISCWGWHFGKFLIMSWLECKPVACLTSSCHILLISSNIMLYQWVALMQTWCWNQTCLK